MIMYHEEDCGVIATGEAFFNKDNFVATWPSELENFDGEKIDCFINMSCSGEYFYTSEPIIKERL